MNHQALPEGYQAASTLDLSQDVRVARLLTAAGLAVIGVMTLIGVLIRRPSLPSLSDVLCFVGSVLIYLVAHEGVHGLLIRLLGGVRPDFGTKLGMFYAGSERVWFDRRSYLLIALAPVLVLGAVLIAACVLAPPAAFWLLYAVLIFNVYGSVGDLYVVGRVLRLPPTLLVRDTGVVMEFCLPLADAEAAAPR